MSWAHKIESSTKFLRSQEPGVLVSLSVSISTKNVWCVRHMSLQAGCSSEAHTNGNVKNQTQTEDLCSRESLISIEGNQKQNSTGLPGRLSEASHIAKI
eukprot:scaffold2553_cov138-Cylindrotheca_fusiformis.AAC.3